MTGTPCPISRHQRESLQPDLTEIKGKLQGIASLLRGWYGEETQPYTRALETLAALQRLEWALERENLEVARAARV